MGDFETMKSTLDAVATAAEELADHLRDEWDPTHEMLFRKFAAAIRLISSGHATIVATDPLHPSETAQRREGDRG